MRLWCHLTLACCTVSYVLGIAGASTSVYEFDSEVRSQHVHKSAWTPLTDKMCKCILWEDNKHDKYAVND